MIWKKASEEQPSDREEVLIRDKGNYHLAVYDKNERVFILRNGTFCQVHPNLFWTKLIAP